jgi:hypothetical protein
MRSGATFFAIGSLLVASCSLFGGVDDLKGESALDASLDGAGGSGGSSGAAGGASSCTAEKGCQGCASCRDYCGCSRPLAIQSCMDTECVEGGAGASGAAGGDGGLADGDGGAELCDPSTYLNADCGRGAKDQACADCLKDNCCALIAQCFSSTECAAFASCTERECGRLDGECGVANGCDACLQEGGTTLGLLWQMGDCAKQGCGAVCGLCQPLQGSCSPTDECCSGICNAEGSCCLEATTRCSSRADCCDGYCESGACCKPLGAPCGADAECCNQWCYGGRCYIIT